MSAAGGLKAIRSAIEARSFAPAYYFFGDDDYLKDEMVKHLVAAAVDPATRDFNLEVRRASDLDGETLGSLLDTPPMMAERRAVIVRDVGALRKNARGMLDRYLESPAPDVLLVLVAPAGAKVDRTLLVKTTAVEFEPLSGARIPKWITHYAASELEMKITPDAATLLQDAVGIDLAQLKVELDKLASFAADGVIDEVAVSAIVGVRRGETLGTFLDAVGRRDVHRALALVPGILQQPKTSAVTVVMALATQTLALAWGQARRARGIPAGRLSAELMALLREGSAYPGRSWTEAVESWVAAVDHWTPQQLDHALEALLQADVALKESRLSSDEQQLANLVLELCADRQQRAA